MKKAIELILIILFTAGLFAIAGYTIFGPQDTVSYYEQRPLKPIPKPTLTALWTGEYFTDLEAAYTDHIALRNTMLKLHTKAEMGMGKVTVNGVTAGTKELLDYNGFLRWGLTEVFCGKLPRLFGQPSMADVSGPGDIWRRDGSPRRAVSGYVQGV